MVPRLAVRRSTTSDEAEIDRLGCQLRFAANLLYPSEIPWILGSSKAITVVTMPEQYHSGKTYNEVL